MTKIKNILIIIPVLFILISCDSKPETGILYKWEPESKSEWKTFGDLEFHQKYVGELSGNEPHGDGIMYYPNGRKIIGFWRRGKINYWTENGVQKAILYGLVNYKDDLVWSLNADKGRITYEGEFITKDNTRDYFKRFGDKILDYLGQQPIRLTKFYTPHGFGTSIDNFEEKYVGYWKNGEKDGEGIINYLDEEYIGIKEVGEWKDGKQFNTITYDNDGAILGKCNQKPFTLATMNLEIDPDRSSCEIDIYFLKLIREKSKN